MGIRFGCSKREKRDYRVSAKGDEEVSMMNLKKKKKN